MAPTAQSVDLHIQLHGTGSPTRTRVSFTCDRNAAKLGLAGGVYQVEYIQWSWKLYLQFFLSPAEVSSFLVFFLGQEHATLPTDTPRRTAELLSLRLIEWSVSGLVRQQGEGDSPQGMSRQADVNLSLLRDHRDAVGNRLRVAGLVNGELHR